MKTLKKVLSLVLVVAMIASMLIVGAAAAEETQYPEAAAVISGIKVMEGDERGMRYGDTVTRAEAAAIICRVMLGDNAEVLKTSVAPFADVAATHWAAGYISYLKAQGIVSGRGNGFDPNATVTGTEFAKMLLSVAGYGKAGEFDGDEWEINTITKANQLGVYADSNALDRIAQAATREECMLYAFNTITKIPVVNYNKTFETYYVGDSALTAPADPMDYTLAKTIFNLDDGQTGTDIFGRPATGWFVGSVELFSGVATATPVYTTSNAPFTTANLYTVLGKNVATNIDAKESVFYVDGVAQAEYPAPNAFGAKDYIPNVGFGTVLEIYVAEVLKDGKATGKYDVDIVAYTEYLTTVKSYNTATKVITLANNMTIDGKIYDITGLVKGDYVLYTKGNVVNPEGQNVTVLASYNEVAPVLATYTAFNGAYSTIVADGTTYVAKCKYPTEPQAMNLPYDLYCDSYGNVLEMNVNLGGVVTTAFDYAYVTLVADKIVPATMVDAAQYTVKVQLTYANGGSAVVDYEILTDATGTITGTKAPGTKYIMFNGKPVVLAATGDAVKAIAKDTWYSYTMTENGITLKDIDANYAKAATKVSLNAKTAAITVDGAAFGKIASGSTVLTTLDPVFAAPTVVTGYANFAKVEYTTPALITYAKGSNVISNIYVLGVAGAPVQVPFVYCAAAGNTISTGTEYSFITAAGETLKAVVDAKLTVGGIYTLTDLNNSTHKADAAKAYTNTEALTDVGYVNAFGAAYNKDLTAKGTATIGDIEANVITTLAITENDVAAGDEYKICESTYYYFDAATIIVDCTGRGATTISEGDVFAAYINEANITGFAGAQYCSYIWIIG